MNLCESLAPRNIHNFHLFILCPCNLESLSASIVIDANVTPVINRRKTKCTPHSVKTFDEKPEFFIPVHFKCSVFVFFFLLSVSLSYSLRRMRYNSRRYTTALETLRELKGEKGLNMCQKWGIIQESCDPRRKPGEGNDKRDPPGKIMRVGRYAEMS